MTVNKRKKNSRQSGSKTHGWGSMKKHRGAGNRGGRGRAGSGAKGDAKKPSYRKEPVGKIGFRSPLINQKVSTINLSLISQRLENMIEKKQAVKGKSGIELDLTKLKIDKLLGSGNVSEKLIITVGEASAKAIEKVEAAGGKVTVLYGGDEFEDSNDDAEEEAEEKEE
ncbi:50S ribosomal protein L15 [Candidatus Woesearchaeota archaeon]|nr:MAG: 50S ribosomal protein L15 [Candidatus Woesearchaeota archaeon]